MYFRPDIADSPVAMERICCYFRGLPASIHYDSYGLYGARCHFLYVTLIFRFCTQKTTCIEREDRKISKRSNENDQRKSTKVKVIFFMFRIYEWLADMWNPSLSVGVLRSIWYLKINPWLTRLFFQWICWWISLYRNYLSFIYLFQPL